MRRLFLVLIALVVIASACGSDSTADIAADPAIDFPAIDDNVGDDGDLLGAGPYPIADLLIEVQPDGTDAGALSYRLACLGDTATLSGDAAPLSAESMCLALDEIPIRTRLINGIPVDQLCTEIYGGPQLATVTGTIDGETIDTTVDRANGCGIDDWDRLLAALLPTA